MTALHDMHCHLDFMENSAEVAGRAANDGSLLFANTVTPQGWIDAQTALGGLPNVLIGFGMHPWWVQGTDANGDGRQVTAPDGRYSSPYNYAGRADDPGQQGKFRNILAQADSARMANSRFARKQRTDVADLLEEFRPQIIGEVGLDLGPRHTQTHEDQVLMFERIMAWTAREQDKLVSLHSVKAAAEVLDILQRTGALETNTFIFHWFTGPSDLLKRSVEAGCYFSCGPRMLATKKGREYVKAIPLRQLLLETDDPPKQGAPYPYENLRANLESVARDVATIKGPEALDVIAETSVRLLTNPNA